MSDLDGPRYAVVSDGELVLRCETSTLARMKLDDLLNEGEFLELKIVNVRLMQEVLGFINQDLAEEIASYSITEVSNESDSFSYPYGVSGVRRHRECKCTPESDACEFPGTNVGFTQFVRETPAAG